MRFREIAKDIREGLSVRDLQKKAVASVETIKPQEVGGFQLLSQQPDTKKFLEKLGLQQKVPTKFQQFTEIKAPTIELKPTTTTAKFENFFNKVEKFVDDQVTRVKIENKLRDVGKGKNVSFTQNEARVLNTPNLRGDFNKLFEKRFDEPIGRLAKKVGVPESSPLLKEFGFDPSGLALSVALFSIIGSGAAKKGKTTAKTTKQTQKQIQTSGQRFSELELDEIATGTRNRFIKEGDSAVREQVRKILLSKDPKQISAFKRFLQDSIGKKATTRIFRDVKQQELIGATSRAELNRLAELDIKAQKGVERLASSRGVPESTLQGKGIEIEFAPQVVSGRIPQSGVVTSAVSDNKSRVAEELARNEFRTTLAKLDVGDRVALAQGGRLSDLLSSGLSNKQKLDQLNKLVQQQPTAQKGAQAQRPALRVASALKTLQAQKPAQKQQYRRPFGRTAIRRKPRLIGIPPPFQFRGQKSTIKEFGRPSPIKKGYNVFVGKKNKKVNVRPLKRKEARSLGAFLVDQSLSARFSIRKTDKKPQKSKIRFPKSYFEVTRNKYRENIIRKGKPIFTKDKWVELRGKRLDTLNERKKITVARLIAQRKIKTLKKISKPFSKLKKKKK